MKISIKIYSEFINLADSKGLNIQYIPISSSYDLYCMEDNIEYWHSILNQADITDFEANYKNKSNRYSLSNLYYTSNYKLINITPNQNIPTTYTSIYSNTNIGYLCNFYLDFNNKNLKIKCLIDDIEIITETELDNILHSPSFPYPLIRDDTSSVIFNPKLPIKINNKLEIYMKANRGTKKLNSGSVIMIEEV